MSGQPVNSPLDIKTFRQAYMRTLELQAANDKLNLDANMTYKKTGAPSAPEDTRTTTEKLSDLYRIRVQVRSALSEIMDGDNAQRVVESLDDNEARFLAQQVGTIIADLKPKYALGVPSEVFIPYLQKYMQKTAETQGVEYGLQQDTGKQLVATQNLILENMASGAELSVISQAIKNLGLQNTALGREINVNLKNISDTIDFLPETFNTINEANNSVMKTQLLRNITDLVKDLPTKDIMQRLIVDLDRATQQRDLTSIETIMRQIAQITSYQGDLAEELRVARAQREELQQLGGAKAEPSSIPEAMPVTPSGAFGFIPFKGGSFTYIQPSILEGMKKIEIQNYIEAMRTKNASLVGKQGLNLTKSQVSQGFTKPRLIEALTAGDDVVRSIFSETIPSATVVSGRGMKGCGVSRTNLKIDMTAGMPASNPYVPFGKYFINRSRLSDGIVMMKRGNGMPVCDFKTKRVSPNLLVVFKKIAGGNMPSFSELEKLDDDEREYLKFVSRKSSLTDKLEVPSPKKDKNETLINQFEIMRGELCSGNDSKDLIKKFKKVIVEMVDKELLPKQQARDILIELARIE
jgi:hypothetical protein